MSKILIQQYYARVEKVVQYGGSRNETAIRNAFYSLLNSYCEARNLELVPELEYKDRKIYPDGTVKDALRLDWGYWESKDQSDDLDEEIKAKFAKGYPGGNILFEDSRKAVLFQGGIRVAEADIADPEQLDKILTRFLSYQPAEVRQFRGAVDLFRKDLPEILVILRRRIDTESETNSVFKTTGEKFLNLCRSVINPHITETDVREMIIQHILTEEIFLTVFDESQFHRENNIARELQNTVNTFFTGDLRRNTLDRIKTYYLVIKKAAANIANHHEKQRFLKALYENFYTAYNPKGADRLGIFYTPDEIVRFMIESTDYLLYKCFGRMLGDKGVEILDPAAGTGTFAAELIEYLPKAQLAEKYKNEIFCNEVSILPYYIANLNIEFTYKQKTGEYSEFKNICFMDTLDHAEFSRKQSDLFAMTVENTDRIRHQNKQEIFVIIGNPPYNANQKNENENNKNREYPAIDERIKLTYIKKSSAQKTKLYDMYARFFRWAADRIGEKEGVVAFVSNSSFIDARTFDGFRKTVAEDFDEIHIVDLGGNIRKKEKANVFGIRVGVAVSFMIKYGYRRESVKENHIQRINGGRQKCKIFYYRVPEYETSKEKLMFLRACKIEELPFQHIVPDENGNWINLTDNDFEKLLPLADKDTKSAKNEADANALFKLFSLGVCTNRDEWVYDFSGQNLEKKVKYLIAVYNENVKRYKSLKNKPDAESFVDYQIKWTRAVKKDLIKGKRYKFDKSLITDIHYRPFVKQRLYLSKELNEMQFQMSRLFPDKDLNNLVICFTDTSSEKPFMSLISDKMVDLHFTSPGTGSQCLPLYRFDESGKRLDNITEWGLNQFRTRYKNKKITKEDIFHYVYAVLHNPEYRKKYEQNLKRELPRIPFYENFNQWVKWGKELADLHINYETVEPYPLVREDFRSLKNFGSPGVSKPRLKADKEAGKIIIDSVTALSGVPETAWEYKLGTYSALQWILEQYKEKKIKDPTIAEKFNNYRFEDYKEQVIDLLMRVCTVSVKTMEIVRKMKE